MTRSLKKTFASNQSLVHATFASRGVLCTSTAYLFIL